VQPTGTARATSAFAPAAVGAGIDPGADASASASPGRPLASSALLRACPPWRHPLVVVAPAYGPPPGAAGDASSWGTISPSRSADAFSVTPGGTATATAAATAAGRAADDAAARAAYRRHCDDIDRTVLDVAAYLTATCVGKVVVLQ